MPTDDPEADLLGDIIEPDAWKRAWFEFFSRPANINIVAPTTGVFFASLVDDERTEPRVWCCKCGLECETTIMEIVGILGPQRVSTCCAKATTTTPTEGPYR